MRRTMTTVALLGRIGWVTAEGPKAVEKSASLVAATEKERTTALEHGDVAAIERILRDGVYAQSDGRWQMVAWQSTRDAKLSPLQ